MTDVRAIPLPAPSSTPSPLYRAPRFEYEYQAQKAGGYILWRVEDSKVGAGALYTIIGYAATPKQVFKYCPNARPFPGDERLSPRTPEP